MKQSISVLILCFLTFFDAIGQEKSVCCDAPAPVASGMIPQLTVKNLAQTVDFYSQILGFEVLQSVRQSDELSYVLLKSGNVLLAFQSESYLKDKYPQLKAGKAGKGSALIIETPAINRFYERIKGRTEVISNLTVTFFGAQEFVISDPEGYVLIFRSAENPVGNK